MGFFKTERNIWIAKHAMAQRTWLERLCVASKFWKRADGNDAKLMATMEVARAFLKRPEIVKAAALMIDLDSVLR